MKSTFTPLTVRWTIEQTFPSWKFSNAILHQEPAEMLSLPLSPVTLPSLYSASTCRTLQLCPAKQRCLQHLIRGGVRLICFIWSQAWAGFRAEVGAPFLFSHRLFNFPAGSNSAALCVGRAVSFHLSLLFFFFLKLKHKGVTQDLMFFTELLHNWHLGKK